MEKRALGKGLEALLPLVDRRLRPARGTFNSWKFNTFFPIATSLEGNLLTQTLLSWLNR